MKKTIGIIGGMGPLATCDLFRKIIDVTDAKIDQEHVRVCIDSNTEIPDRTEAIIKGGKDPVPEMVSSAKRLESIGADLLIMPCNTAHFFYSDIVEAVDIPVLNMIEETAKAVQRAGLSKVGLLATDGTVRSGVYSDVFVRYGIELIIPDNKNQKSVMDIIYNGIKSGNMNINITGFKQAINFIDSRGAESVILGCTELPIAFDEFGIDHPIIDPTMVLAIAAVDFSGAKLKSNIKEGNYVK